MVVQSNLRGERATCSRMRTIVRLQIGRAYRPFPSMDFMLHSSKRMWLSTIWGFCTKSTFDIQKWSAEENWVHTQTHLLFLIDSSRVQMSFGFSTKSDSEEDLESRCYYVVTAKIQYRAVALDSCSPVVCSLVKTRFNRENISEMPILIFLFPS